MARILPRIHFPKPVHHSVSKEFIGRYSNEAMNPTIIDDETEFRKLELIKKPAQRKPREKLQVPMYPPRYTKMPIDQDWNSVWPTAQVFKPSVIPIPLRQGYVEKGVPPGKFGNLELMKIPNFFHLTPPAIKTHCQALKKFCTAWPEGLETDEKCEENFPIEFISSDYCHSGPVIRDPRSRIVSLQVKLKNLKLDSHAKDKLLRLLGDRYDETTDIITLAADRCPMKRQNYDYLHYLIAALYHESRNVEVWEESKSEDDMEKYVWTGSISEKTLQSMVKNIIQGGKEREGVPKWIKDLPEKYTEECVINVDVIKHYAESVTQLHRGETEQGVEEYKSCVKKLLGLENVAM